MNTFFKSFASYFLYCANFLFKVHTCEGADHCDFSCSIIFAEILENGLRPIWVDLQKIVHGIQKLSSANARQKKCGLNQKDKFRKQRLRWKQVNFWTADMTLEVPKSIRMKLVYGEQYFAYFRDLKNIC